MAGHTIESVNEASGISFGGVLLAGFSALMDGVTTIGQLTLQERLREQFPERYIPASTTFFTDPALNEIDIVNDRGFSMQSIMESLKNANPLIVGGVALGAVALFFVLK